MLRRSRLASRPRLEQLDPRCVLSALTPTQISAAYGLGKATLSNGTVATGAGQTIAIVDAYNDPNIQAEINAFDAKYGLPATTITVDNLSNNSRNTNAGWEEEEALDVEAAHLAAPGAKIVLVEAKSASTTDLVAAIQAANAMTGVSVVSLSWGGSDSSSQLAFDSVFTKAGVTYLAASGDDGAGTEWPSDSPNVVAVGGTSLNVSTSGRSTETAWSGSGGGASRVEAEPSFQAKAQSSGKRETPDVSAVADPNTGLKIYTVAGGGWVQIGGTSLSTPLWAGIIAVADQGRVAAGKPTLSSSQTLADLYNAPSGSFFDVTGGTRATSAYDTSTGLGSPNAAVLIPALINDPAVGGSSTGNGVGGDLTTTSTTPVTTGTTTTTPVSTGSGGTTTPPRSPWDPPYGGRGGFFGGYGFNSGPRGWAFASVPRNSGQAATVPFTPIAPVATRSAPAVTLATGQKLAPTTFQAIDEIIQGLGWL